MRYEQALDYIHSATRLGARQGHARIRALLHRLGDPQKKLRFVHIAGTNGKGSTAVLTAAALTEAGARCGLFISPYVLDFRERMQINGQMISKQALAQTVAVVAPLVEQLKAEGMACTEFEIVTAVGLTWFAEQACDIVVLEVGLGGRLDPTNVIDAPEVCAVTSISFDHVELLGDTIEKIAGEKCGILKPGADVAAYCDMHPDALRVLRQHCESLQVQPNIPRLRDLSVRECTDAGSVFAYMGTQYRLHLCGMHQIYNALTAIAILQQLRKRGWRIPDAAVQRGFAAAQFVGRLQQVRLHPLCLIDGAHNLEKITALRRAIDAFYPGRRLVCVMGILQDKAYEACVAAMAARSSVFIAATPGTPRALPAEKAAAIARTVCPQVLLCSDPFEAARVGLHMAAPDDIVLACGSLYMLADAKKGFETASET